VNRRILEQQHSGTRSSRAGHGGKLDLQEYFPYRIAVLAEQVSLAVAQVYADRFELTRQEWRVLAALGGGSRMVAAQIGPATGLDKMQVSRALDGMEKRQLIVREEARGDRRKRPVRVTTAGAALFREIAPFALNREKELLAGLLPGELRQLDLLMSKISAAAQAITGGTSVDTKVIRPGAD